MLWSAATRSSTGSHLGFRWLSIPRTIKQILETPPETGSSLSVNGHIKTIRRFKKIGFVDISDGTTSRSLPVVLKDTSLFESHNLKVGQSISVTGTLNESKGLQAYEVTFNPNDLENKFDIIGNVHDTYPIQKKAMTLAYLRHHPSFRHRTLTLSSVLRVRSLLESHFTEFFDKYDFVKVAPPMLTGADCEGAGEQFEVEPINPKMEMVDGELKPQKFFGKPAYLTVSTQLHLEILSSSMNRVWTLAPCFRAEDSNTNRHLSEFWLLEAELSYISQLHQLTDFTESMIKSVTQKLIEQGEDVLGARYKKEDQQELQSRWNTVVNQKWPRITYNEAIDLIKDLQWGDSLLTEHEKWLAGEYFKSPVFITDYPKFQKPFYMPNSAEYNEAQPTVACYDLIFPHIGELVGGSLRQHDHLLLEQEMNQRGMKLHDMQWYLAIRQNGSVPHGGFGMGFERLILYLTGLENIRDVVAFPRSPGQCET